MFLKVELFCGDLTLTFIFIKDPGSGFGSRIPLNPDPKHWGEIHAIIFIIIGLAVM